ncbi:MAG: ribosome assembly RNA-binding protein YhbY [Myxococcota bacterium]|nr:ribosome assembly RNA-binding protein YhbY [Myxococcota bacterium]MEC8422553.1 ribosome assembly RNA-binding protein YhbY [Myxococcota bacterium]
MALDNTAKRHLRGLAHRLEPIARIGSKRVTDGVVAHIDELLEARELIKVRLLDADRDEVIEARDRLVAETGAEVVQMIGGTLVLFRRRAHEPEILLPGERPFAHQKRREKAQRTQSRSGRATRGRGPATPRRRR